MAVIERSEAEKEAGERLRQALSAGDIEATRKARVALLQAENVRLASQLRGAVEALRIANQRGIAITAALNSTREANGLEPIEWEPVSVVPPRVGGQ